MLNLNQVNHFLQITRSGSLTAAAEDIGISAPALSKSLASLERQLGSKLFDRVGRGLALTDFGAQFVIEARELVGHTEKIVSWAQSAAQGQTGLVRIGCGPAALHGPVRSVLAPSLLHHRGVRLRITSGNTTTLLPGLEDYSLDFLLTDPGRVDELTDSGRYRVTPLPPEEAILVCGKRQPLALAPAVSLTELLELRWVTPQIPEHYRRVMRQRLQQEGAPESALRRLEALPDIQLDDLNGCLQIAATSDYVTATLASNYSRGELPRTLRPLPIDLRIPTNISIIQISNRTITPAAQRLADLLAHPQSEGEYQIGAV